MFICAQMDS